MRDNRSGFTLMEIMVVVVIIAVLASVAGPMIGDIINQGKASATRSKMSSLKSAIVTYKNDVGRYPFTGDKGNISNTDAYNADALLGMNMETNVLVNQAVLLKVPNENTGSNSDTGDSWSSFYGRGGRKWKGPYMDSDPADFMTDSWGTAIRYHAFDHSLILWSAGPDGLFDEDTNNNPNDAVLDSEAYAEGETDDLFISIARFRRAFN